MIMFVNLNEHYGPIKGIRETFAVCRLKNVDRRYLEPPIVLNPQQPKTFKNSGLYNLGSIRIRIICSIWTHVENTGHLFH